MRRSVTPQPAAVTIVYIEGLLTRCAIAPVQWQPTREGYLKFLAESRTLFETLENIVEEAAHPDCERIAFARFSCFP